MGLDTVELVMDLEDAFGISMPGERIYYSTEQLKLKKLPRIDDPTVGQIHLRVCDLIRESGREIPPDSWIRVQKCIANLLAVKAEQIRPDSHLFADLGAS